MENLNKYFIVAKIMLFKIELKPVKNLGKFIIKS